MVTIDGLKVDTHEVFFAQGTSGAHPLCQIDCTKRINKASKRLRDKCLNGELALFVTDIFSAQVMITSIRPVQNIYEMTLIVSGEMKLSELKKEQE